MHRILMIAIAVPALALFGLSQTAQAQHRCGGGGYYGGGYGYSAPRYSYAPAYSYRPVYQSAYARPSYGISVGFGRSNYGGGYGGGYRGGFGGYRGGHYGGHHHHHH